MFAPFVIFFSFFLTGCSPVFSPSVKYHLASLSIGWIEDAQGQTLRRLLMEKCAMGAMEKLPPLYLLTVRLEKKTTPINLQRDGRASVNHVTLTAYYEILHKKSGVLITSGQVVDYSLKNLSPSYYSTTVSEEALTRRSLSSLSFLLMQRLASFFDTFFVHNPSLVPKKS